MEGLEDLKKVILNLAGEQSRDMTELERLFTLKEHKKNDFFLNQKSIAKYIGFVVRGAFREFYTDKAGREYNKTFCFSGQFTGSYYDLASGKPSNVSIQAMADSTILIMSYREYKELMSKDTFWMKVGYAHAHNLLMYKLEKEYQLLTLSAKERYELLLKENPKLEQLVPAYHIASFLGITPISLSRLRSVKKWE
jgi:CRP-like cAMP-binding protein